MLVSIPKLKPLSFDPAALRQRCHTVKSSIKKELKIKQYQFVGESSRKASKEK